MSKVCEPKVCKTDVCKTCKDNGSLKCHVCTGGFQNWYKTLCTQCYGAQKIACLKCKGLKPIEGSASVCVICNNLRKINCPICLATGVYMDHYKCYQKCKACSFSGQLNCPNCNVIQNSCCVIL